MLKNKTANNFLVVMMSNITSIVAGIIVAFIVPKLLSVDDYGYYKTFTLFTGYMGLLNLGIADGIVLDYGGYNYEQLDKFSFRSFFRWFIIVHIFFCGVMGIVGLTIKGDYGFIWVMLALNTLVINTVGYFQQISQITQRFKELSIRKILQSISSIIAAIILFLIWKKNGQPDYKIYVLFLVMFSTILAMWYFYTYREIILGKRIADKEALPQIRHFIQIGFPLLFANICSTLILTLDSLFVNVLFNTIEYAAYAFAYNMLSLVTVATSAASTVLYPSLKRTSVENLRKNYSTLIGFMQIFVFAALVVYFPLCLFIDWYLPKYIESLVIFRIIFPGLAISSCVTVIMHNYYKVLGNNLRFFKKSIIVLLVSGLANATAYYVFRTTSSISIASIIVMMFWYIYVEHGLESFRWKDNYKNTFYLIGMGLSFYLITIIPNMFISGGIYIIAYCILTFIIQRDTVRKAINYMGKNDPKIF